MWRCAKQRQAATAAERGRVDLAGLNQPHKLVLGQVVLQLRQRLSELLTHQHAEQLLHRVGDQRRRRTERPPPEEAPCSGRTDVVRQQRRDLPAATRDGRERRNEVK